MRSPLFVENFRFGMMRPEVQADHPQGRRTSRDLRVCSAGAIHALLRCVSCIDSSMALAILKVYKSVSRVPAAQSIDNALVNCVRNRITSFNRGGCNS